MIALPPDATGLGLTLQWCPLTVTEDVWHILDVAPNSPADHAGLLPYGDYIIGTPEGIVRGESGLGELVEDVSPMFFNRVRSTNRYKTNSTLTDPFASTSTTTNMILLVN